MALTTVVLGAGADWRLVATDALALAALGTLVERRVGGRAVLEVSAAAIVCAWILTFVMTRAIPNLAFASLGAIPVALGVIVARMRPHLSAGSVGVICALAGAHWMTGAAFWTVTGGLYLGALIVVTLSTGEAYRERAAWAALATR